MKEVNAAQIEQILKIPAFSDAIEEMKWEQFSKWLVSETVEQRETIHAQLSGVLLVQAKFDGIVANAMYDAETKPQETEK